jgi:phospholipase A-2-activating protein
MDRLQPINGQRVSYPWSGIAIKRLTKLASNTWIDVGTVVDAAGSSGKKIDYLGKEYDYVFDVDMEDGKPALKLPYNLSQNPYEAATKFIQDNEAPITYLDQVANFIIQNTQGATLGSAPEARGTDPWGSEDRYRPGDANVAASIPTSAPAAPRKLPQKDYLSILAVRVPGVQKKLTELNTELITAGNKDLSMNPAELSTLRDLCAAIDPSGEKKLTNIPALGLDLAIKLSTVWPYKSRLPALDLLRILAASPEAAAYSHPRGGNIVDILEAGATEEQPPAPNHVMMAIRGFANLFSSAEGRKLALASFTQINALITKTIANTKDRNPLVAAVTVYINFSVLFASQGDSVHDFEPVLAIIDVLTKILATQVDSEVVYRAMVALGTLLGLDKEVTSMAKDVYGIEGALQKALGKASDPRIRGVASEIRELL